MSTPIRIAILGGGLAGASLLHALRPHEHLDAHIFESAPAFKEAGMAIGVASNALEALDLIGPSIGQCLQRAGAVPMRGVRFMLAQGPSAGEMFAEVDETDGRQRVTSIVHRAAFLHELLADVSPERMHASKQLERFDTNSDGSLTLRFADGSTHNCDILIGADGIRSTVRKILLGEDDPAASPRNTGAWCIMALKPYALAQASLGSGPVDFENAREYMWIGNGAWIMHNLLNDGQLVQFVVAAHEKDTEGSGRRHRTVGADEIKKLFEGFPPHLVKAVNELLCDQPEQPAMYLWDHPPARTYVSDSGSICIMGDAAHATTPWQASGGGMSIEDTLILSALLGRAKSVSDARTALGVYDKVRRPRTQRIVESSRGTGQIALGLNEEFGLDYEKMKANMLPRWGFIVGFDNEKHRDEALELLARELEAQTEH
ncbi:salicylate hydroxylase [Aspergillus steynii IBT 23096]|uniref:Salicylate hydroxylase n=1 Tax=Aspergillus steynii IBT 23096 TaxID=1392250 RepID=A0A2I2G018_9EURO|nr:salicylate hydroxylase [Aspergillus steynii IBT 23096]PLB46209.1 salicylate hydroxylase [Aspergillus steynii IBT 23096]